MTVTQLTITIPDTPGQLAAISEMMGDAGVNIIAFFVTTAVAGDEGLMRFVADNPEKAHNVLSGQGVEVKTQQVMAAETPHHAGGLLAVLNPLKRAGINVSFIYPTIQTTDSTVLIIGVQDGNLEPAVDALQKDWIRLYGEELYNM